MADRHQPAIAVVSAEAVVWLQDRPASGTKLYAEPVIDLSEVPRYVLTHYGDESTMIESPRGAWVRLRDVETVLDTPAAPAIDLGSLTYSWRVQADRLQQKEPEKSAVLHGCANELDRVLNASAQDGNNARSAETP